MELNEDEKERLRDKIIIAELKDIISEAYFCIMDDDAVDIKGARSYLHDNFCRYDDDDKSFFSKRIDEQYQGLLYSIHRMTTAAEILKKPYGRTIVPEPDGTFRAEIVEFPGCIATGDTAAEALAKLEDVAESWLEAVLLKTQPIPEPIENIDGFSGKLVVRLPKSLHKKAAHMAARDGVSLNQFIVAGIMNMINQTELDHLKDKSDLEEYLAIKQGIMMLPFQALRKLLELTDCKEKGFMDVDAVYEYLKGYIESLKCSSLSFGDSGFSKITDRPRAILSHDETDFEDLRGRAPDATGLLSSEEFIRELRDEW